MDFDAENNLILTPADNGQEVNNVKVTVTRKIYSSGNFIIFACRGGFSVKGNFDGDIIPDCSYEVSGKVSLYGKQPQIVATGISSINDANNNVVAIAAFLVDRFEGIGKKTANELASKYQENILNQLLNNPDDTAKQIKGLSVARARKCSEIIDADEVYYGILLKLRILGLTNNQSVQAYKEFGVTTYESIMDNPFVLMNIQGIGFETCERLSQNVNCDPLNVNRFVGGMVSVLEELHNSGGHTFFSPDLVKAETRRILSDGFKRFYPNAIANDTYDSFYEQAEEEAVKLGKIVIYKFEDNKCKGCKSVEEGARIALKRYFLCELAIKKEIESFVKAGVVSSNRDIIESKINKIAEEMGIVPEQKQIDALYMCLTKPFSIVTGGPGTGKTTIMGILSKHLKNEKISCKFCAPTGRAAKRLSEATGIDAYTVHKLLEMNSDEDETQTFFGRNRDNPLDARVIIVDEASMLDEEIFKALLYAVKKDASVILIGDPNQLPSVAPGNVLADLLSCNSIPRVELEYVFRQEDESSIPANAVRILEGRDAIGNNDDFIIINVDDDTAAAGEIIRNFMRYKDEDTAILCPTKQNDIGTFSLNRIMQNEFVQEDAERLEINNSLTLCVGDRVMQMHNNYQLEFFNPNTDEMDEGVFNGEIGNVVSVNKETDEVSVSFDDGKIVTYDKRSVEDIDLAYAMTVHKSQGCEFETVIIALGKMNNMLSSKKLLYTAITRGKKRVIIVNSAGRLQKMIRSGFVATRNTSLKDFLNIVETKIS